MDGRCGQDRAEFAAETDISVRSRQWTSSLVYNEHVSMKANHEVGIYHIRFYKIVSLLRYQAYTTRHKRGKVDWKQQTLLKIIGVWRCHE